jgi:hypothetical protein
MGRKYVFKLSVLNKSLLKIITDNKIIIAKFGTHKFLVTSVMFPHYQIRTLEILLTERQIDHT